MIPLILRAYFLGISVLALLVKLMPNFNSLLLHGKLRLKAGEKDVGIFRNKFLLTIPVPKRFFWHFYLVGCLISAALLWSVNDWLVGSILRDGRSSAETGRVVSGLRDANEFLEEFTKTYLSMFWPLAVNKGFKNENKCLITWSNYAPLIGLRLLLVQVGRRLWESLLIEKHRTESKMLLGHYIVGITFYIFTSISMIAENSLGCSNFQQAETSGRFWLWAIPAISLFLWASWKQHECHSYLASLRTKNDKAPAYPVPIKNSFQLCTSPHYFYEILIYTALAMLFGFQNWTVNCCLIWVCVNLSILARENHDWYGSQVGRMTAVERFVHQRRAVLIPGVY